MAGAEASKGTAWRTFLRLASLSKSYSGWYGLIGVLSLASSIANIGRIDSLRRLMQAALTKDTHGLWSALFVGLAAFFGGSLVDFTKGYVGAWLDQGSTQRLQVRLVGKLQRLPTAFVDRIHSGDIISRVLDNTGEAQAGLNQTLVGVVQNILNVVMVIGYLVHLNWQLTVGTVIASLAIPACLVPLSIYQKRLWDERWKMEGDLSAFVQDSVQGGEVSRAYGMAGFFRSRFIDRYEALLKRIIRTEWWGQSTNIAVWVLMVAGLFFVLGYGGLLVSRGALAAASVAAFLVSFEQISFPIANVLQAWPAMQKALGAADRVFELLDAGEQRDDWGANAVLPEEGPDALPLCFHELHFSYEPSEAGGTKTEVLKGLSFVAEPGEVTAVVGESGSGKSTLLKLVLGMYRPDSGELRLGARPLTAFALDSWRSCLGYVSQEVCLFPGSVMGNIGMGRLGADSSETMAAAQAAHCAEFAEGLPSGYDSEIGEKGVMLSGGQRQRIAIARAILKRPRLLLLDEATSALDNESERFVQDALERFSRGRSTLVVAHRLSTIMGADKIVFLESGVVAEQGTHAELMAMEGKYYAMFTAAYGEGGEEAI